MKKHLMFTVMIFIILQVLFTGCTNKVKEDYIVVIDGEKVSLKEFKIYLYESQKTFESLGDSDIWETSFEGNTAEDVAKNVALNSITQSKISAKKAKDMNITLTEQDRAKILIDAANFMKSLNEDVFNDINPDETLISKIMEEKILYEKVFNEITKDYELSEKDFELYYNKNIDSQRDSLIKLDIQYIFLSTYITNEQGKLEPLSDVEKNNVLKKAQDILLKAQQGEDFTELIKQYSEDYKSVEKNGREILSKGMHGVEFEKTAFALKEGEISNLVATEYGYCIIKLNDIINPNEEEMMKDLRDKYILMTKQQIFENEYNKWISNINIEKNIQIWDEVKIYKNN